MGQRGSREAPKQEPQFSGVRITSNLVDQLQGIRIPRIPANAQAHRPSNSQRLKQEEANRIETMQQNELLSAALDHSVRIGDMLLTKEEKELEKISTLTDELLAKDYSAPSRENPCIDKAHACIRCLQENDNDAAKCADVIHAYSYCASNL